MIKLIGVYEGKGCDPYVNLATEQWLFDSLRPGEVLLYLWQNDKTVVIGRNQRAESECNIAALEADGGRLARRFSGGGAVYHDMGNLNFTFLAGREDYSVERQLKVITNAVALLGVAAEVSGRNDIIAGGAKFSGNAFYTSGGKSYHHGTLLISTDMSAVSKYLYFKAAKAEARGVKSVRARVVNLNEISGIATVDNVREALIESFLCDYGAHGAVNQQYAGPSLEDTAELAAKLAARAYLLGEPQDFGKKYERRLSFGTVEVYAELAGDVIKRIKMYSDALDISITTRLEAELSGAGLNDAALSSEAAEVARMISEEV